MSSAAAESIPASSIPTLSYTELKALQPCEPSMKRVAKLMGGARKWNGHGITAEQARAAGASFDDIIWAASAKARHDKDVERRLRLWLADCAARVLPIFEKHRPGDTRPRDAIMAARQFARGEIGAAAWAAAWAAAGAAAWAAAGDAAGDAAWAAAGAAAGAAAWAAAGDAAGDAAGAAAWAAERQWQFDRLVAWLSDEPADLSLPALAKAQAA
jgi:hypothetical protein